MDVRPTLLTDGYKIDHRRQYIKETRRVNANMTARKSRMKGVNSVVVAGVQAYILSTFIGIWNKLFFQASIQDITEEFMEEMVEYTLNPEAAKAIGIDHWIALHKLGYLPLEIRALPEGTSCPIRVPMYTVENTVDEFYWLTNFIETDMSSEVWPVVTAATISREYYSILHRWALRTGGDVSFVPFQGHNFAYRGNMGRHAAMLVDAGHLFSGFVGSDTLPGRKFMKKFYGADQKDGIISCSVFATEHAVMCVSTGFYIKKDGLTWEKYGEAEFKVFKRLITELYPTGIVSIVSDTWDLWKVLVEYMVILKEEILARDGKVVIRPDSGDPVDIMCGHKEFVIVDGKYYTLDNRFMADTLIDDKDIPACKGVIELLWDVFGGTYTTGADGRQYKVLNSKVGAIYGDSITLERSDAICSRLADKGFCSINWVAGIGSYTYQMVTRDTFGMAQKATAAVVEIDGERHLIEIFKDPITDDGTKKSAKGLVAVFKDEDGNLYLKDQCTREEVESPENQLKVVFKDGELLIFDKLQTIRSRVQGHIAKQKVLVD